MEGIEFKIYLITAAMRRNAAAGLPPEIGLAGALQYRRLLCNSFKGLIGLACSTTALNCAQAEWCLRTGAHG